MNKILGCFLLLTFFACKAETKQEGLPQTNTIENNADEVTQSNVPTDTLISNEEMETIKEKTMEDDMVQPNSKPEKPPVYVEPKPRPIDDHKKNTNNGNIQSKIDDDNQPSGVNQPRSGKPEKPPVYVDPKPKPADNKSSNVETSEGKNNGSLHDDFDKILSQNVSSNGKVNYNKLKSTSLNQLNAYLKKLEDTPAQASWSKNKRLAYWINVYNAFTIKKIVDNYPLKSITDLNGGKPWDEKWIKIGGKTYSLNNIENDIIRPQFNDPRIHFAVNCAAKSCPPLLNKAYTEDNLNTLLNNQTSKFINNNNFNEISSSTIKISKIFEWYKEDFGNVVEYINKYANTKVDANAKVAFMEYNWALNN